jgi:hypothetical protein
MARQLILQNLMKLARGIGANPSKFMGTRTNITFLGKGPTKNPLFQGPLGIESATEAQMGSRESVIGAVEDAMAYATAGKLNSIQIRALELNLQGINKMFNPPVLPSASVTNIASGIAGLRRFPKESHKFFGRPLKDKDFAEIDELVKRGKLPPAEGKYPKGVQPGSTMAKAIDEANVIKGSRLPEPGSAGVTAMLEQKTGMSRAIARQILQQDTRLNLPEEVLVSLRTGSKGADPLDLMKKYYGESMMNFDDFLNSVNVEAAAPAEFAEMILKNVRLIPQFSHGGLARILEV